MLKTEALTKVYEDGIVALSQLDMEVKPGEIYCLLGANGAGKSTTINLFLNFISPTRGGAFVDGIDVTREPIETKRHLGYVPENVMLYRNLTALQNLGFFVRLAGRDGFADRDQRALLAKVGLAEDAFRKRVKDFSKGMRQKLALAIALSKGAGNLLLDEPTSGLDPKAAHDLMCILLDLKGEGKSILMSTHDVFRAREVADRVGIMRNGKLVCEMTRDGFAGEDLHRITLQYMEAEAPDPKL